MSERSERIPASASLREPMSQTDVIELARALVRAPSANPPGDERAVADVVGDACSALGLPAATVLAALDHRPNLLVSMDFGAGGRHLVLSGHLDTKPIGDATWSADPLGAELDGDRLYGLGSADMKGAVAAMLVAAGQCAAEPPPRGRLSLLFTADEENGGAYGARHVAYTKPLRADGVVIGEPGGMDADFDRLHLVSRGIARLRLTATGRQGHSSLSAEPGTRNAGVDLARLVTEVADRLRLPVPPNPDGLTGWTPTVNTGLAFHGGVGYGVLPGRVGADTEVRLLPGMTRQQVGDAFGALVQAHARRTGAALAHEFDEPPNDWLPPARVPATDPLALAAAHACLKVLGTAPPTSVFPGTTDATFFQAAQGLPTLPALGPGLLRRAHAADEWVSAEAVRRSVALYSELVREFCPGPA